MRLRQEEPDETLRRVEQLREKEEKTSRSCPSPCRSCRLRRLCAPGELPGIQAGNVHPVSGELVCDPAYYARNLPRYYDPVDRERLETRQPASHRVEEIRNIISRAPDRVIDTFSYRPENAHAVTLHGTVRWFSWSRDEKRSTSLGPLERPFTVAVTFGGGMADFIGFSLGRYHKIVCPMLAYHHRLVLHVTGEGHYVLLRDGVPVVPADLSGPFPLPVRVGPRVDLRLSLWNIDGVIGTQDIQLWERSPSRLSATPCRFSVIIVCTRFARRLAATLVHLARLPEIRKFPVEIIVAYVPGLDATDDTLDTLETAFPDLRIVRHPFPESRAHQKGFLINESVRVAGGEWLVLLDADILLPPGFFDALDVLPDSVMFACPDGRKMLSPGVTARVLTGDLSPVEAWETLAGDPGEIRYDEGGNVPVGYCQCVRRACFDTVQYREMAHFEGADWEFAQEIQQVFGPVHRLEGYTVFHLDHGSSNWYGTPVHR